MKNMNWSAGLDTEGNIKIRLLGVVEVEDARAAALATIELLGDATREIHIEAAAIEGYRAGVHVTWQAKLWDYRRQIPTIRLFDANTEVRINIGAVAMSLGIPLHACRATG